MIPIQMQQRANTGETNITHNSIAPVLHSTITRRPLLLFSNDPRHYQIAVLSSLLFYGVGWLEFDIAWPQIPISLGTALITHYFCTRIRRLPSFHPRSPLISALSLCFLLRPTGL